MHLTDVGAMMQRGLPYPPLEGPSRGGQGQLLPIRPERGSDRRKALSADRLEFRLDGIDLGPERINFLLKRRIVLLDDPTFLRGRRDLGQNGILPLAGGFAASLNAFDPGRIVAIG